MPSIRDSLRRTDGSTELPRVSEWLLGAFARYTHWYLQRHFDAMRVSTSGWLPDNENGVPKVVYLNHASWWDPLVCLHLSRHLFSRHRAFAPIDAQAIAKYAFFRRLGFFGVEPDSPRGAARFFRVAHEILSHPWHVLWVTPQGRFADARERPLAFKNGLGHLASRLGKGANPAADRPRRFHFVPLAIEYTFWHEPRPEILLRFGEPLEVHAATSHHDEPEVWTARLEARLEAAMDGLAEEARLRQPDAFLPLLRGRTGVGGIYDLWRRAKSLWRRQPFDPKHGRL
ncbi:MAG: lysophospholipid acyltransferase family protein [Verrucomicrobiales bacterium]|nr:lysophospholipid acyltransferase family protein [Verrucomicrobiales bacterium]